MRERLLEKLELLRQKMVAAGLEQGLNHPQVLEYSQRIDQLHNELNRMNQQWTEADPKNKSQRFYIMEHRVPYAGTQLV